MMTTEVSSVCDTLRTEVPVLKTQSHALDHKYYTTKVVVDTMTTFGKGSTHAYLLDQGNAKSRLYTPCTLLRLHYKSFTPILQSCKQLQLTIHN